MSDSPFDPFPLKWVLLTPDPSTGTVAIPPFAVSTGTGQRTEVVGRVTVRSSVLPGRVFLTGNRLSIITADSVREIRVDCPGLTPVEVLVNPDNATLLAWLPWHFADAAPPGAITAGWHHLLQEPVFVARPEGGQASHQKAGWTSASSHGVVFGLNGSRHHAGCLVLCLLDAMP